MRRALRWLIVLAVLGALGLALVLAARPDPPVVQVERVRRGPVLGTVSSVSSGIVEPRRRVTLQAEALGRVSAVRVARGQRVRTGQILVELDAADVQDQVRTLSAAVPLLEARLQQARTRVEQLRADHQRVARLAERGVTSRQQLESSRSARDLAAQEVDAARAALQQARVNLGVARSGSRRTVVRAPFDGVVLDVLVEVGDQAGGTTLADTGARSSGGTATPGAPTGISTPLAASGILGTQRGVVDLADDGETFVLADVDELDYGRLRLGQPVQLTFDALRKRVMTGDLIEIYPYVSRNAEQNRTVRVKVRLPAEARGLVLPGMSTNVEVITERRERALVLPTACVLTRQTGKVALRIEGDRLREVPLRIGLSNWDRTEILGGLREDDEVAVPSTEVRLGGGMKVRRSDAAASARR